MARIAHVTATFPPYWAGTGNVAFHDARVLAELGHEVTVFTAARDGETLPPMPFEVERLPSLLRIGNASLTPALPRRLAGYDLVHLHVPYIFGADLASLAVRRSGQPLVVTYHNDLVAGGVKGRLFDVYTRVNLRWVLRSADLLVTTSADYADHSDVAWAAGRNTPRVVVPNGVDTSTFRPDVDRTWLRQRTGVADGAPLALFVGGLDRPHFFKGLTVLIEALAAVPAVHLAVVGEGDLRPEYEARARALAPGRVHFLGKLPLADLVRCYAGAFVTILPSTSRGEAFGMVLAESMACGTAVIASDLPGVRTVVADGETGFLVPPGDADALADKISLLASARERARAMGACGREHVARNYEWSVVVGTLAEAYDGLLTR